MKWRTQPEPPSLVRGTQAPEGPGGASAHEASDREGAPEGVTSDVMADGQVRFRGVVMAYEEASDREGALERAIAYEKARADGLLAAITARMAMQYQAVAAHLADRPRFSVSPALPFPSEPVALVLRREVMPMPWWVRLARRLRFWR